MWITLNSNVLSPNLFLRRIRLSSQKKRTGTLFGKIRMNAICFHKNFGKANTLLLLLPHISGPHFEEKSNEITYYLTKYSDHNNYFERCYFQMSRKKRSDKLNFYDCRAGSHLQKPCYLYHGRRVKSTFPPDKIIPTRFPANIALFSNTAPKGTADEGSTMIFIRSQMWRIVSMIVFSSTSIISLT